MADKKRKKRKRKPRKTIEHKQESRPSDTIRFLAIEKTTGRVLMSRRRAKKVWTFATRGCYGFHTLNENDRMRVMKPDDIEVRYKRTSPTGRIIEHRAITL